MAPPAQPPAAARPARRRAPTSLALAALALLALAGAGHAQTPPSGALTIGINQLATSMDPPTDWIVESTWIHMNVFDCLVWRNRETAAFEPWLAEGWEAVDDTTWRFRLRPGVTFHNGEPFDADAVLFSYQRILDEPTMLVHNQWTFIAEMRAPEPLVVEIVTQQPDPAFLSRMAGTGCGIQAPVAGRARAAAAAPYEAIGTGPYRLVEFNRDERIVLEANPTYWGGAPAIQTLVWRAIPEPVTRTSSLLTGAVDLITAVSPQDVAQIDAAPALKVVNFFTNRVMLLSLRAGPTPSMPDWTGPTADVRVRNAIELAIDRRLVQEFIGPSAIPVLARTFPPTLGWVPELYDTYGTYDPEEARRLLAEAGYAGEPIVFHVGTQTPYSADVAAVIAELLSEVGLNVDLRVLAVPAFREQVDFPYKNEEMVMNVLNNSFFDPWIEVLAQRSDRRERSGWTGPKADRADELIRASGANMDPESRAEQIREVNRLIYEESVLIHLFRLPETIAMVERLDWNPPPDGFLWFGNAELR
jgi:peptide/nickel transport system substrate-binding protein